MNNDANSTNNTNSTNIEIITIPADTLEQEPVISMQEKFSSHFDQAKTESKTRAKRIQDIFKAAFADVLGEVKGGL